MLLPNNPSLARQTEIVTELNEIVRDNRVFGITMALAAAGSFMLARRVESKPKAVALGALGLVLAAADTVGVANSWAAIGNLNAENSHNLRVGEGLQRNLLKHHTPEELEEIWAGNPNYFGEGVLEHANGWARLFDSPNNNVIVMAAHDPAPEFYTPKASA